MDNTGRNQCKATVVKGNTNNKLHEDDSLEIRYEIGEMHMYQYYPQESLFRINKDVEYKFNIWTGRTMSINKQLVIIPAKGQLNNIMKPERLTVYIIGSKKYHLFTSVLRE